MNNMKIIDSIPFKLIVAIPICSGVMMCPFLLIGLIASLGMLPLLLIEEFGVIWGVAAQIGMVVFAAFGYLSITKIDEYRERHTPAYKRSDYIDSILPIAVGEMVLFVVVMGLKCGHLKL